MSSHRKGEVYAGSLTPILHWIYERIYGGYVLLCAWVVHDGLVGNAIHLRHPIIPVRPQAEPCSKRNVFFSPRT